MLQLLKDLNKRLGVTIIIVTHDMNVVRAICDYVFVIDGGQIKEQGVVEDVFYNPRQPITKSLISSMFTKDIPQTIKGRLVFVAESHCQVVMRLLGGVTITV